MYETLVRAVKQWYQWRMTNPGGPDAPDKLQDQRSPKEFRRSPRSRQPGEEIVIMRGNEVYARIGPAADGGKRPFGLLRHRGLPDNLFDTADAEQAAIDAGDWNDDTGVWQGKSNNSENTQ